MATSRSLTRTMLNLPKGFLSRHSTETRQGYFFQLFWDHPDPNYFADVRQQAKVIFDRRLRLEVEFIDADRSDETWNDSRCRRHPEIPHFMKRHCEKVYVRRSSEGIEHERSDGLIYCPESGYNFIGTTLRDAILENGLTGLVVTPVDQQEEDFVESRLKGDEIVMIEGECNCWSPVTILPVEANRCEQCGFGPLCCPECGRCNFNDDGACVCVTCGDIWQLSSDAPKSKTQKQRIQDAEPFPEPFLDSCRWDGSDFNAGMVVTQRVVNLFERLKCGSFRAVPIPLDVTGLTDEQWQRLEASHEPC